MTAREVLLKLPSLSALVVGDVCLDRWCSYDPELNEPSRETGIPRTAVVETEITPGAAGTVANNLVALGVGRVAVLSAVGRDGFADELKRELNARHIENNLLASSDKLQTFTYTKLINAQTGVEDLPRVDFINTSPLHGEIEDQVVESLRTSCDQFDVILVSDQAETDQGGVVTRAVRDTLSELAARAPEKLFFVDSRARLELFRGLTVKANEDEARAACLRNGFSEFRDLLRLSEAPRLFVTHGKQGVLVIEGGDEHWIMGSPVEKPVDICGAGDSFSAGAAMCLASSGSAEDAARFGNIVASITIMKRGTGTASPDEILASEAMAQK